MSRELAGIFDPAGCSHGSRLITALAPRRASVLECGPLSVACTGAALAPDHPLCLFAGFLDNAREIAGALGDSGRLPVEQLLGAGYRRWGRELLGRLRGEFVLLVWDAEQGEGLIARDQLGARAVYLSEAGGVLRFAGELHQLLALLPTRPAPDPVSVAHWIAVSNRPGPSTLYEGVRRLDPGSALLLDRRGVRELAYWRPRYREPPDRTPAQLAHETREQVERAVQRRIDPDGLTGVLMSGGLDSASVAAVAAMQAPARVAAFAGVFPEHPAVDESGLIGELRRTLSLPGATIEVRAGGLLASALESLATWEAPLLGWGDFWTLPLLRAAAAAGVTRTLGGDGGDELFGARAYLLADRLRHGHPGEALGLARELPGAGDHPAARQVARVFARWGLAGAAPAGLHQAVWRAGAGRQAPRWMRRGAVADLVSSDEPFAWKRLDGPRWWAHIAHGLTRGVEEAGIFEHQRRRAAMAGLQARHPLFDLDLVELVLGQSPRASFDRHRSRPVLRASMAGLLPDSVRLRPAKAWFDSLIADCMKGPDREAVRSLLSGPGVELGAYVELDGLRDTLLDADPREGPELHRWMHQLWRLVTAECWLRAQAGSSAGTRGAPNPSKACLQLHQIPRANGRALLEAVPGGG